MKHKLGKKLKESIRRETLFNIVQALYLLYVFLNFTEDENVKKFIRDVAGLMFKFDNELEEES